MVAAGLMERLEAALGPREGEPEVLGGGLTNRNLRVRLGGADYVLRLCAKETEVLGIDREAEVAAASAAHALGLAPEVVLFLTEEGCVVTRFVAGREATAAEVRSPALLARLAAGLRAVHAGPPLPVAFDVPALSRAYAVETVARGGAVPAAHRAAQELADRIAGAFGSPVHPEHAPVPCHDDLLTANVLLTADGDLQLVDWEYAGMGDRFFDLGNLAVNNELDEDDERRLLDAYFGDGGATPRRVAALRLMRLMSDVREASWGMLQAVLSELDADFTGYADRHFARLAAGAADPRLEGWLRDAAA
jgi:aminoglycoside phosphotransferase (APT) family kinase protein